MLELDPPRSGSGSLWYVEPGSGSLASWKPGQIPTSLEILARSECLLRVRDRSGFFRTKDQNRGPYQDFRNLQYYSNKILKNKYSLKSANLNRKIRGQIWRHLEKLEDGEKTKMEIILARVSKVNSGQFHTGPIIDYGRSGSYMHRFSLDYKFIYNMYAFVGDLNFSF